MRYLLLLLIASPLSAMDETMTLYKQGIDRITRFMQNELADERLTPQEV